MKATTINHPCHPAACRFPNEALRQQKLEKLVDWALMTAICAAGTAIIMFFFIAF